MAKMVIGNGIDQYAEELQKLYDSAPGSIKRAVYEGAKVVTDAVRSAIKGLPEDNRYIKPGEVRFGVRTVEKQGLLDGLGVSHMEDDNGMINVRVGENGYNNDVTKKYPKGKPNAMIARSIESGTSFQQKYPVFRKATNKAKKKAEYAMAEEIDKEIKKTMEG